MNEELISLIIKIGLAVLTFISAIITIIFAIKKSGNKVSSCLLALVAKLPFLINDAEAKGFVDGKSKFNYVMDLSINYLASLIGTSSEVVSKTYKDIISNYVEDILSTPQKKD